MSSSRSVSTQIQDLIQILDNNPNPKRSPPKINHEYKAEAETAEDENDNDDDNHHTNRLRLKCARGTRDYHASDMYIRNQIFTKIQSTLNKFGAQLIETPVFELRDLLMDKYGEDEKLIYELALQETEHLALRYDLTVPLARYIAMNRKNIRSPFKAVRHGRVYRRDQPYMTRGRMREFWQYDFDIVRTSVPTNNLDLILDDCEIIHACIENLQLLFSVPDKNNSSNNSNSAEKVFQVRINNRKLLDIILQVCNVTSEQLKPISSAIDKFDKKSWGEIKQEMIEKGISDESAEHIKSFICIRGKPREVLQQLADNQLIQNFDKLNNIQSSESVSARFALVLQEFEYLLQFLESYNKQLTDDYLILDMSMVRGLDYYTGLILECSFSDKQFADQYGSIAGGGRYDNLISSILSSESECFPCVGLSLGIERIFAYLKNMNMTSMGVASDILICELGLKKPKNSSSNSNSGKSENSNGDEQKEDFGLFAVRLQLLAELRAESFNCEIVNKIRPDFRDQINFAEDREIKWMVIIGEEELEQNTCNLRRLMIKGDMILLKDERVAIIQDIYLPHSKENPNSKWPVFYMKIVDVDEEAGDTGSSGGGNKKKKSKKKYFKANKKEFKQIIENGLRLDFQIKGVKREELVAFFKSLQL